MELQHRTVATPAGRTHVVEAGHGPLVLLVHGFPETWHSWRHQLPALADAGYRAVAYDVRGHGRSSKPTDVDAYRLVELVADVVAVIDALGATDATVLGHDWGSPIAATAALLVPDTVNAVGLLSVPFTPPGGPRPGAVFAAVGDDPQFYVPYLQQSGRAENEIEPDVRGWLTGFHLALGGDAPATASDPWFLVPRGGTLRARFPPTDHLPAWLPRQDIDVLVEEFERTGSRRR